MTGSYISESLAGGREGEIATFKQRQICPDTVALFKSANKKVKISQQIQVDYVLI